MSLSPILTDPDERRLVRAQLREESRNPPFDPDVAENVVQALASGMGITAIGSTAGYPAYWVINFWRASVPEFDEACVRAAEAYAEQLAYEVVPIADGIAIWHSERSTADRSLSVQTRFSAMKYLNRKKYDPAVKVTVSHGLVDADAASDAELARVALGPRAGALTLDNETGREIDEADAAG